MKSHRSIIQTLFLLGLWLGVGLQAQAQTGTVTYIYTDQQGTPLAEADVNGTITATFDYAPYGSQALGTAPNGPGYTGHVNDPDTGLVYMQARYYDPSTGRFLSVDPAAPSAGNAFNFSRYVYANNNPVINIDTNGRFPLSFLSILNFTNRTEAQAYHDEVEVPAQSAAKYVPTTPAERESSAAVMDNIVMVGAVGEMLPPPVDAAGSAVGEGASLIAFLLKPTDERALSVFTAGAFKGFKYVTKGYSVASETVENASKASAASELTKSAIEYNQSQQEQQSQQQSQQENQQQSQQQQRQQEEDRSELGLW